MSKTLWYLVVEGLVPGGIRNDSLSLKKKNKGKKKL